MAKKEDNPSNTNGGGEMNETLNAYRIEVGELRNKVEKLIRALSITADVSEKEAWDIFNNLDKQGKL